MSNIVQEKSIPNTVRTETEPSRYINTSNEVVLGSRFPVELFAKYLKIAKADHIVWIFGSNQQKDITSLYEEYLQTFPGRTQEFEILDPNNFYFCISNNFYKYILKEKNRFPSLNDFAQDLEPKDQVSALFANNVELNFILNYYVDLIYKAREETTSKQIWGEGGFYHEFMHYFSKQSLFGNALSSFSEIAKILKNTCRRDPGIKQIPTMKNSFDLINWIGVLEEAYSMLHEFFLAFTNIASKSISPLLFDYRIVEFLCEVKLHPDKNYTDFFLNGFITNLDIHILAFMILLTNGDFLSLDSDKISSVADLNIDEINRAIILCIKNYHSDSKRFLQGLGFERLKKLIETKLYDCLNLFIRDCEQFLVVFEQTTMNETARLYFAQQGIDKIKNFLEQTKATLEKFERSEKSS